jgi:transmembrane sensor
MSDTGTQRSFSRNAAEVSIQASEWIVRKELPEWSEAEQADLDAWLGASPNHRIAYLRAGDVWQRANRLQALKRPSRQGIALLRERGLLPIIVRVAAALGLVAVAGVSGMTYLVVPRETTYRTAVGGRETIPLADGSQVELNTDTVLRVSETSSQRTVKLDKGEAYFSVKHDAARPFVVLTAQHRITDLGTKFEIRSDGSFLKLSLFEGRARLETTSAWVPAYAAILTPGDVAVATIDTMSVTKKSPAKLTNELGWRRGVLVFEHTTLEDAVAELNRYNRQQIVIADPAVALLKIDATLPTDSVEGIVRVAQDVLGVRVTKRNGEIVISR